MKKIFLLIALALGCFSAQAQVIDVYKNGTLLTSYTNSDAVTYRVIIRETPSHEMVDLGLSVKWATCNIGAETAYDAGLYFAWGETSTKTYYDWKTYQFGESSTNMTKYNATDNLTTLEAGDDAATIIWGSDYRMPTQSELEELRDKCDFTWDDTHKGWTAKSKTTNNSIFFPAAGIYDGKTVGSKGESGYYRSSTLLNGTDYNYSASFSFSNNQLTFNQSNFPLYYGCPVRPVSAK